MEAIGKSVPKKDSFDKVTGAAQYTGDHTDVKMLYARMTISSFAHARIIGIDTTEAGRIPGVRAILTGEYSDVLTGEEIRDRPVIAKERVRFYGETVAVVVADTEAAANRAADSIRVRYEPLPVVNSPRDALRQDAPIVHEKLGEYEKGMGVIPIPGTNVASVMEIRKGDMSAGLNASEVISVQFAVSDHAAMETRSAIAEIKRLDCNPFLLFSKVIHHESDIQDNIQFCPHTRQVYH